jgi:hydroxymethylpyrimidine/phosphomethylpyrimidine kinase
MSERPIPTALTIAGSDSGGGAGIQADLKTFTALGVFGMAAITSVTAQNTIGVAGIHDLPAAFVARQIDLVAQDIGVDAAKTGMLSNEDVVEAVAACMVRNRIVNLVVDPVMVSKSGHSLMDAGARKALVEKLLPLALIVTPNLPEAEILSGMHIAGPADIEPAAARIFELGPKHVLVKGGHLHTEDAVDYLFDDRGLRLFPGLRIPAKTPHGTGCTHSAALAAYLAKGWDVVEAVARAKAYLTEALHRGFQLGHGPGVLNHFWPFEDSPASSA